MENIRYFKWQEKGLVVDHLLFLKGSEKQKEIAILERVCALDFFLYKLEFLIVIPGTGLNAVLLKFL